MDDKSSSVAWVIRHYRVGDLPAVMDIVRARAVAYNPELLLGVDAVLWRLQGPPGSEPRPAIVVTGPSLDGVPEGGLLGAGSFSVEGSEGGEHSYVLHFWGHPAAVELGVEHALVDRLLEMVRDYEAHVGSPSSGEVSVFASYSSKVPGRKELFDLIGMSLVRIYLRMELSLLEPIDTPADMRGVTLRNYRRPEDNAGACAAYNNSFSDHFDHHDEAPQDWDRGIADPSRRPDLSWLAEIDSSPGEFAGFCICGIYEDANKDKRVKEGWIELLGTTRDWRGKGLGRSLLLHGLHSLKSAGLDTALLGVDSESPTGANRLYEKVGFQIRERTYVYGVALKDAKVKVR